MKLPTEKECLEYFKRYHVPENIFQHCQKVKEIAMFFASKLNCKVEINLELVKCLGILHDLFKMVAIKSLEPNKYHNYKFNEKEVNMWKYLREKYPNMYEGDVAYDVFKENYPELALRLKRVSNPKLTDYTWEELIVHYADWRTFREEVVELTERLKYLQSAYPSPNWDKYEKKMRIDENKIFSHLNFKPEDLAGELENVKKLL